MNFWLYLAITCTFLTGIITGYLYDLHRELELRSCPITIIPLIKNEEGDIVPCPISVKNATCNYIIHSEGKL